MSRSKVNQQLKAGTACVLWNIQAYDTTTDFAFVDEQFGIDRIIAENRRQRSGLSALYSWKSDA